MKPRIAQTHARTYARLRAEVRPTPVDWTSYDVDPQDALTYAQQKKCPPSHPIGAFSTHSSKSGKNACSRDRSHQRRLSCSPFFILAYQRRLRPMSHDALLVFNLLSCTRGVILQRRKNKTLIFFSLLRSRARQGAVSTLRRNDTNTIDRGKAEKEREAKLEDTHSSWYRPSDQQREKS